MATISLVNENFFGAHYGFGPVRKTRKSAQREADIWNDSRKGARYQSEGRSNVSPAVPPHFETIECEVWVVEGGFVCTYVTTREPVEVAA